ncbi:MAG: hypothetical protein K2G56_00960, partial [Eubacterium sp.]|nr:hypothetical protein [Eubacterium sp.]
MKALIIFSVIFIFIFIGAQPYVEKFSSIADMVCRYLCDILIVANLCVLFSYYSKYGKSDKFLESVEYELSDYGSYITSREEKNEKAFIKAMQNDFSRNGYAVNSDIEIDEFDFSFTASPKKEFLYTVETASLSRSDVLAY